MTRIEPTDSDSADTPDLQAAAHLVLQREQDRESQLAAKARRRMRQRQKQQFAAIEQMRQSIEVIKWCIVSLAVVLVVGLMFIGWTLSKTQQDVAAIEQKFTRIEADVDEIERQVEHVKSSLLQPLQTLGKAFGSEIDAKLEALIEGATVPQKE